MDKELEKKKKDDARIQKIIERHQDQAADDAFIESLENEGLVPSELFDDDFIEKDI